MSESKQEEAAAPALSLSKIFPLTAVFGDEAKGNLAYRQIVGLRQNAENKNHTDFLYTGDTGDNHAMQLGYHAGAGYGNSVVTSTYLLKISDVFQIMSEACRNGEIADFRTTTLNKLGIIQSNP